MLRRNKPKKDEKHSEPLTSFVKKDVPKAAIQEAEMATKSAEPAKKRGRPKKGTQTELKTTLEKAIDDFTKIVDKVGKKESKAEKAKAVVETPKKEEKNIGEEPKPILQEKLGKQKPVEEAVKITEKPKEKTVLVEPKIQEKPQKAAEKNQDVAKLMQEKHKAVEVQKTLEKPKAVGQQKPKKQKEEMEIEFRQREKIKEGDHTILELKIRNNSIYPIILLNGKKQYGSLSLRGDKFIYNRMNSGETDAVFYTKAIPPTGSASLTVYESFASHGKVRKKINIDYLVIDGSAVKKVFINKAGNLTMDTIEYARPETFEDLLDASEVLMPAAKSGKSKAFEVEIDVEPLLQKQHVMQKVKEEEPKEKDSLFCKALDGWVLMTENGTIISTKNGITDIGKVNLEVFEVIDRVKEDAVDIWVQPDYGQIIELCQKFGKQNEDNIYHSDAKYHLKLPKDQLIAFLDAIRNDGHTAGTYAVPGGFTGLEIWVWDKQAIPGVKSIQ